jgi:oligopeptide transport system substrate-binding protein
MNGFIFTLIFAVSLGAVLAPSATIAADARASRTFTFRLPGEPTTLDWNLAQTPYEIYLLMNLMEGLVHLDEHLKAQPALAESWQVSDDQRTYTFKIRSAAQWSDGAPVKAQQFVDSWRRLLSPLTDAPYAYYLFDIEGAEMFHSGAIQDFAFVGVKAVNDHTLRVRLNRPVAHWITIPSFWVTFPIRKELVEAEGNAWVRPGNLVTAGPFVIVQHDQNSRFVLKPNTHYYGGAPQLDQLVGEVIVDDGEALARYQAGGLDFMTGVPKKALSDAKLKPQIHPYSYLRTVYLGFNVTSFPTNNVHVRKAISECLSLPKIQGLMDAQAKIPGSFVPPGLLGFDGKLGIRQDGLAARDELRSAGIDPSQGGMPIDFLVSKSSLNQALAEYIQKEVLTTLGLKINIVALDQNQYALQRSLKSSPLFLSSWIADFPDPDNFLSIFTSRAGNNYTNWKNASYDDRMTAARNTVLRAAKEKIYREAQTQLLNDEVVIRPLYYDVNNAMVKSRVQGLEVTPLNHVFFKKVKLTR